MGDLETISLSALLCVLGDNIKQKKTVVCFCHETYYPTDLIMEIKIMADTKAEHNYKHGIYGSHNVCIHYT